EPRGPIDIAIIRGALADVGGNARLSRLEDRAGNPLVPGDRRTARDRFFSDRVLKDELFGVGVCEQNRTGFGTCLFQGYSERGLNELVKIDRLKQCLAGTL